MKSLLLIYLIIISPLTFSKVRVFTTTTNLANVAEYIGGDKVEVQSLCKGHQDPHFLEAKPSYTFRLSRADLLISVGAGLEEGWLPLIVRGSRNPKLLPNREGRLVAANYVEMLDIPKPDEVTRAKGDVHPEGNPHFMLGPSRAIVVANAIKDKLTKIDPENKDYYIEKAKLFQKIIEKLKSDLSSKIKKNLKVITYHKTLTYFYDEFGVKNVDVLEPKPGIPPSASHVLGLIKRIKDESIKYIVVENYFDTSVAKRIKKEIPSVKILQVPVAVKGADNINSLTELYSTLVKGLTN